MTPRFAEIPLDQLVPNDYNARRFQENMTPQRRARFEELVESIRQKGILEPILVRPVPAGFEVIAGERRYRAALQVAAEIYEPGAAGENYLVPCMVRQVDDDEAFDLMVIENLQREDLTPFETAHAFRAYLDRHGFTADAVSDLAIRTGIPAHAIRRQVRLLDLPVEVLAAWKEGTLSQTHAEMFTRLGDREQTLELLALTLRLKLSTRELADRIGAVSPDLDKGYFDKGECQACPFNTSVQSGLFADVTPAGKCGNPACFEAKQGDYLAANWLQSKPATVFGTCGYRFSHRLAAHETAEPVLKEPADRCRSCDAFVTLLRVTGAVVSGYGRTCTGPRNCFEELYCATAPVAPETSNEVEKQEEPPVEAPAEPQGDGGLADKLKEAREKKKEAGKPTKPATPPEETGPVFNAARGEKYRELFLKAAIPHFVGEHDSDTLPSLRLILLALGLASNAAKTHLVAGLGLANNVKPDQLAEKVFEIPLEDLMETIQGAAVAHVLDYSVPHAVRRFVAAQFGIDLVRDWKLTREYLDALTVSEIVRVGEEENVGWWDMEEIRAYRKEKHKGKALRSLKKGELIDMILSVDGLKLYGRTPAEIVGKNEG